MRLRGAKKPLSPGFLLLSASFLLRLVGASSSPAISVGLKASWTSPPFVLELLETIAEENSTAYFPLLDRIASSAVLADGSAPDKVLYDEFLRVARAAGFLAGPDELSAFNFALSIHAAAPRIEAHYHYYAHSLEPLMGRLFDPSCPAWVLWASKQRCAADGLEDILANHERFPNDRHRLQFDRPLETAADRPAAVLYADIRAPGFRAHHERLKRFAEEGRISYRLRYRPPVQPEDKRPLMLSGYGVSLVLKKTDYVVMDDRDVDRASASASASPGKEDKAAADERGRPTEPPSAQLDDAEGADDIKPLQKEDLAGLGYKAASFVMASSDPLATLQRLVEDFPRHAATIAAGNASTAVGDELKRNWEGPIGPGENLLWINGLPVDPPQVNAFALLQHLRRERRHINGFRSLGLSSQQAVRLLSHNALVAAKEDEKALRFDYRDAAEGGNVIVWLNDLEKDSRYRAWTKNPAVLMRRVYPGQLHPLRLNIHHLVVPADLSSREDLALVCQDLRSFVDRRIAIRFGIVPLLHKSPAAVAQAKLFYHLVDSYGLQTALKYMDALLAAGGDPVPGPSQKTFNAIVQDAKLRDEKKALSLDEVLADESLARRIGKAGEWSSRLGANTPIPPLFVNGQPLPKDDDWLTALGPKLQTDIAEIQSHVYENPDNASTDFAAYLLEGAAQRRSVHAIPQSEDDIKLLDVAEAVASHRDIFAKLPRITSDKPDLSSAASVWVVGDFDEQDGYDLLAGAVELQRAEAGVDLVLINNPQIAPDQPTLSTLIHQLQQAGFLTPETLRQVLGQVHPSKGFADIPKAQDLVSSVHEKSWSYPDLIESASFWKQSQALLQSVAIEPGQRAIIVNGRIVGPIPKQDDFVAADFKQLLGYEHSKRIKAVLLAAQTLGITEAVHKNNPLGLAALTNLVALTAASEGPTGLLQTPDSVRSEVEKMLKGEHTSISVGGDKDSPTFQIVASIDPASETAQKWVPLLKALSEMSGVHLRIFLNPTTVVKELPIKRFYRHVLNSTPTFDTNGRISSPRARFDNIPQGLLLSLSMDVPSSWLVTPKESIHDLDNLKLAALKERLRGSDVEALYELENILIEGHSREYSGQPPRGAQLVLGTEKTPRFADTIIMANLGYFQFKANPGIWRMGLKEGRSKTIFKINTLGNKKSLGQPASLEPDIALMSFQGATLFPQMSRNPGMEEEDVLETPAAANDGPVVGAAKKWFGNVLKLATDVKGGETEQPQAEINIFSVASGHLYERFLNIMMLSVMKNTKHTVKFWFIENFLSPSFKDFIPIMAKEYGFKYELVTYKWPHWLRAQKEKQREIWGYKILFLDVLFPLDLNKVIFVDADQIVRTDLKELVDLDLDGAPYGFTPMCDSREEIEGFRFWKQGYWKTFLQGLPYHISALYVVDLQQFRQIAAGDRLRQQYHQLSADPESLANLDQDLPNHMQSVLPIKSLPQDWLWCETWCSDESLRTAKTIDLCNNPMTKEPKLDRARRQVPEWTLYDEEVARLARRQLPGGHLGEALPPREGGQKKEEAGEKNVKDEL